MTVTDCIMIFPFKSLPRFWQFFYGNFLIAVIIRSYLTRRLVSMLIIMCKNDKYLHHKVYRFVCIVCTYMSIFFFVFSEVNSHVMKDICSLLSAMVTQGKCHVL